MRRITVLLCLAAGAIAMLAACGGSSSGDEETPTSLPTEQGTLAPSFTPTTSNLTPVSMPATTTATAPAEATPPATPTPEATATTPSQSAPTAVPTSSAPPPPPTPTPVPQSSAPLAATVGASPAFNVWSPSTVTVQTGGTVTWAWSTTLPHNVVGNNFPVSSPLLKADTVSHTFAAPGTYTYYCEVHPDTMRGTVIVQ